ncbi:hypothetical protein FACS1894156_6370 [Bacteroidia bacterium]|nr:hypothetical protein FACS1894156_6370 [Bacteroidia bacterium]
MKKTLLLFYLIYATAAQAAQINIPRIEQMPNLPPNYALRNWKQVAIDYDSLVFDVSKTGTHLPLTVISAGIGINYPAVHRILMDTYVGHNNHGQGAEAINVIPAIVGASLVGVDKTTHFGTDWVSKVKDFFNLRNGQNVYLNNYSAASGNDWWYDVMPNVFFYQLSSLYPTADADFAAQRTTVADQHLDEVFKLGGSFNPWKAPNMNYRAFNLLTGKPNGTSVPEPETAGSIAWILYQQYLVSHDVRYRQGAELALDFLNTWTRNPSYEIQLPYGIVTAARMNAVESTNYNLDKFLNWTFSSGINTLRRWGAIVGNWNGYEMSGLIGEANDGGNDYAFVMNGFQHAAALAPVAKYDKRYARAIGKWLVNLANASRYFYPRELPEANSEAVSYAWSQQFDNQACIPYESIKENWQGTSPLAMGDAVGGTWAATNLSLYSGSSVGYMAALIAPTNVEGILQIDLNRTDFGGDNIYPIYLYYNPHNNLRTVALTLPAGNYDVYDAISETVLSTNAAGSTSVDIDADSVRLLVLYPAGSTIETQGRIKKVQGGSIIDYHYAYNYDNPVTGICKEAGVVGSALVLYPNPIVNGQLTMDNEQLTIDNEQLIIYNLSGSKVFETSLSIVHYPLSIDISHLPAGVYLVKVGNRAAKVVKQ